MIVSTQLQGYAPRRRWFKGLGVTKTPSITFNATPARPTSVFAPWAASPAYGLCVHPATGEVRNVDTGGPAGIVGAGLAPSPGSLPPCPIQMPGLPTATNNNTPLPGIINNGAAATGGGAETPTFDVWPNGGAAPQPKRWWSWAIGGGVLAVAGAAAYALLHR